MARRLTSLVVFLLAAFCAAQPFGSFGYHEPTAAGGFLLSHQGFQVKTPNAVRFTYIKPYTDWKVYDLSDTRVAADVSTTGLRPRKLKVNLFSPGFSLYFETGFSFTISSKECPYLTWPEGSVGPDVPTPPIPWVLISFKESQPPVLVSFPSGNCAIRIAGSSGAWTIRSVDVDPHWLHIVAPLGSTSLETSTAAQLGTLVQKVTPNLDVWTEQDPKLSSVEAHGDATSVTGTWHFDHAGAVLPQAALFASLNNYRLAVQSPMRDMDAPSDQGPTVVSATADLTIRFPIRSLSVGRVVADGMPLVHCPNLSPAKDIASIWALSMDNLLASCDRRTRDAAPESIAAYVANAPIYAEPFTHQQQPYDEDGVGMDTAAAYALLGQCRAVSDDKMTDTNPLLLSLMLRRDWNLWQIRCPNDDISRRATAIMSVALALGGDVNSRLQAGMLEAGLAAEKGLNLWQWHRGFAQKMEPVEPLLDFRKGLFYLSSKPTDYPFFDVMASPLHVLSVGPLMATEDPLSVRVQWVSQDTSPHEVTFLCDQPIKVVPGKNVLTMASSPIAKGLFVRALPADAGNTELWVTSIPQLKLPSYVPIPVYSEAR